MSQLGQAQKDQLKALKGEFKRLQKQLQDIHNKTGYEDLGHGVLALQIAEHTVRKLSNTLAWAERLATSRTLQHAGRLRNGTRS
jgi:hypothetical protein